jgi:membrane protein implicated in regulation of membrane protease activity
VPDRRPGTPWIAIALGLMVLSVIYLAIGLAAGRDLAEHWEDPAIPLLAAATIFAVIGWRVGVRRTTEARDQAERDSQALRERVVALEEDLDRLRVERD